MTISTTRRRLTCAALALAYLATLSACSTPEDGPTSEESGATAEASGGEVASLETPSADEADGTATDPDADPLVEKYGEPIRLRLDMTDAEVDAASVPYDRCLDGEGGSPAQGGRPGTGDGEMSAEVVNPEMEDAMERCTGLYPLPPWEKDVQNPDAVRFVQAVVDCLEGKGVRYAEVSQDDTSVNIALGGEENDSASISLGMQHHEQCEQEVSASGGWR